MVLCLLTPSSDGRDCEPGNLLLDVLDFTTVTLLLIGTVSKDFGKLADKIFRCLLELDIIVFASVRGLVISFPLMCTLGLLGVARWELNTDLDKWVSECRMLPSGLGCRRMFLGLSVGPTGTSGRSDRFVGGGFSHIMANIGDGTIKKQNPRKILLVFLFGTIVLMTTRKEGFSSVLSC